MSGFSRLYSAQATAKVVPQSKKEFPSFLFAPQVHYGAPLEAAAGAALLIPTKSWTWVDGVGASADRTTFTWSIGASLALSKF